ncbi:MAG: enoyl-CoA hydratase/isomerase family protein [Anaerolineae bacterium]
MTNTLQLDRQPNGVVLIRFNRPEALNAIDIDTMIAFRNALNDLTQDEALRGVILTGAGERAFCSGGDLVELRGRTSEDDARYFTGIMTDALHTLENLPVPVIAAINGYALGGGSEIALACDIRIIDENARMGMVQINMGLTPGWGAGQRLLQIVGYSTALELLLKGEPLRADALLALKLANQKVPVGQALQVALTFADAIAERPPKVVRGIKALLRAGVTLSDVQARQVERDLFPPLWVDQPHLDAVEAFFKRRAAKRADRE